MQQVTLSTPSSYSVQANPHKDRKNNSTKLTVIGGSGAVVGSTLANGKKAMSALERVKILKGQNVKSILKVISNSKLAKVFNNPIGKRVIGGFAGLSAALTVFGSISEVNTAYNFLEKQNRNV